MGVLNLSANSNIIVDGTSEKTIPDREFSDLLLAVAWRPELRGEDFQSCCIGNSDLPLVRRGQSRRFQLQSQSDV